MSTASFELAQEIPVRIRELFVLTNKAKEVIDKDEELYNVLCRSTCVLLASHLEGFLKDLSRSIIADLNYNLGNFSEMPLEMQRSFCKKIAYYEGVSSNEVEGRVKQLIGFFGKNSVNIDMGAFPYKENPNKNPSNNVIDKAMERLGIPNIISSIATPAFEVVFSNDYRKTYLLNRKLKKFISLLYGFPFKMAPDPYMPDWKKGKKEKAVQSLWHAFIEDIMTRRHNIVHGDIISNEHSWEELQKDAEKLKILMYIILYSATGFLSRSEK